MTAGTAQADPGHLASWARPDVERTAAFAALRRLDRPQWVPFRNRMPFAPTADGFLAVVRHAHVVQASRDPGLFGNEPTAASLYDVPPWRIVRAGHALVTLVDRLGRERLREPRDDLITTLVHADPDGERLTPREVGTLFVLLVLAGSRDEDVFADPDRFDVTRSPDPHLGFGGPGPHYCPGANLARLEATAMLRELLGRCPGARTVGEPDLLLSSFTHGVKRMRFAV